MLAAACGSVDEPGPAKAVATTSDSVADAAPSAEPLAPAPGPVEERGRLVVGVTNPHGMQAIIDATPAFSARAGITVDYLVADLAHVGVPEFPDIATRCMWQVADAVAGVTTVDDALARCRQYAEEAVG